MSKALSSSDKARFNTRLSVEEKILFEKAARLGGFRSLTDFVLKTVGERAKEIVEEHETIIASRRDSEIFFEAILNPEAPNDKLRNAAERFKTSK